MHQHRQIAARGDCADGGNASAMTPLPSEHARASIMPRPTLAIRSTAAILAVAAFRCSAGGKTWGQC
jgi:hypothetical protein